MEELLQQVWAWVGANWLNLAAGAPSILLTLFLVEFAKDWVKLGLAKRMGDAYTNKFEDLVVRTLTLPAAFIWVVVLDFTKSWNAMTDWELNWPQGIAVGTVMTAGLAIAAVWAMDYLQIAETARVRFRRLSGVSKADIEAAKTVRKHPPIEMEKSNVDREQ